MDPFQRHDGRVIIHLDYDCFYAAVFEKENPSWKSLPLAVQQKQIIVTCNYEARRRGLYKLQLVREAKKMCPDMILVLGEDLSRFRNASKDNYNFLRRYSWSNKVERLGFDEVRLMTMTKSGVVCIIAESEQVFMDVTDLVNYNSTLLNHNDLTTSFFHLDHHDPTVGFPFDASSVVGHTFPAASTNPTCRIVSLDNASSNDSADLLLRLGLGSHLARHLRHELEYQQGYTCTAGIGTNKLISKLVGNLNKPKGQTTLLPPYKPYASDRRSNVIDFIDGHDIGKIPGIGFKIAQKIRTHMLRRPAAFTAGLVYGATKEDINVRDVRMSQGMGPETLGRLLAGPGVQRDLGDRVWRLINGVDDTEVAKAKEVPQQISIEDSYIKLNDIEQIKKVLRMLSESLIKRMRLDLTVALDRQLEEQAIDTKASASRRWVAHPKTLRLSTRPRPPLNSDGTRSRSFARICKSSPMPSSVFNLAQEISVLAEKLVEETLLSLFRKLHPEKSGWDLSLVNLCATNMSMAASAGKSGAGRDIRTMLRRQGDVLQDWTIADVDVTPPSDEPGDCQIEQDSVDDAERGISSHSRPDYTGLGSEDALPSTQGSCFGEETWDSEGEENNLGETCYECGATMPSFAMVAHERFHSLAR